MSDRYFIDTNVFVHSFDDRSPERRSRARTLIKGALESQQGIISWQVIQEFLNVALRRFERPMKPSDCRAYLDGVLMPLYEVLPSRSLYRSALLIHEDTGYSFYDTLIIASALEGGCTTLFTEDLQDGQRIGSMTIQNPFR